jgi:hypothetical protein
MSEPPGKLPTAPVSSDEPTSDIPGDKNEVSLDLDNDSGFVDGDERPQYVNGEPVINSGRDVSRYLVDLTDEQDPPFTFRSVILGTVVGGLAATLHRVCLIHFF